VVTSLARLTVGSVVSFRAPNGKIYKVAGQPRESEMPPPSGPESLTAKKNGPCDSEDFDGKDRKASKIAPATEADEEFETLADFIATLAPDSDMGSHHPAIDTGASSKRVTEEKRNVHVKNAWIFAFTREGDEDYHVIIGTTDDPTTATYFNAEVSGLPPASGAGFSSIKDARDSFQSFFGLDQCADSPYTDFTANPVPIEVTGSAFFDEFHFKGQGPIGPSFARSQSYWEIHPITKLVFKDSQ